jgi:glycosyltransferase involved in cell wall biosynthesis
VIYPPVAVQRFCPHQPRESFYLAIARFVPYKRVDLIVAAFAQLGYPLVVIGDGSERDRIQSLATANITFLGYQPDAVVANYLQRCRAFIFAAEEDFGITAVEAQAAGAPVIAYGKGGVAETVLSGQTGLFFAEQTVESLIHAVKEFETGCHEWNPMHSRQNAERFSELNFRQQFAAFVDQAWLTFERGDAVE